MKTNYINKMKKLACSEEAKERIRKALEESEKIQNELNEKRKINPERLNEPFMFRSLIDLYVIDLYDG